MITRRGARRRGHDKVLDALRAGARAGGAEREHRPHRPRQLCIMFAAGHKHFSEHNGFSDRNITFSKTKYFKKRFSGRNTSREFFKCNDARRCLVKTFGLAGTN